MAKWSDEARERQAMRAKQNRPWEYAGLKTGRRFSTDALAEAISHFKISEE